MKKKRPPSPKFRPAHRGPARTPQNSSAAAPAPRPFFVPSRWMVAGAIAAGAAISQSGFAATPPGRSRDLSFELALAADRYRGIADLTGFVHAQAGDDGGGGAAAAAVASGIRFEIAPGALAVVLEAFAAQSGVKVDLSSPELGELQSPGVSGLHSPSSALRALLAGTGATFELADDGTFRVGVGAFHEEVRVVEPLRAQSPKLTAPILDTPQSITVVDSELLQAQGAVSLRDALRNVTGISIQAGEGGGGLPGDNLAIRGFTARNDIFVDGVRDFGAYSRDAFNMQQVEVFKGPASAFSGRGSTGGAINVVTKSPLLEPATNVEIMLGTDEFQRGTLDFNQPLGDGILGGSAVRLNAMYTVGDTPGRDAVDSQRQGVAAAFAAGLRSATRFSLDASWLAEENLPDYGIPWVPPTHVPLAEYADQPAPVDFENFYGLTDRDYEETETGIATAALEHDFTPQASLRVLARGGRSERDSVITAPRFASNSSTDLNRQIQARDLEDEILAGQADLNLRFPTGAIEHALVAGAELSREGAENRARTGPAAPLADLFDPDPQVPYDGTIAYTGARTDNRADTVAAYVFDTLRLSERFEAMGGLRYDRLDVDFESVAVDGVRTELGRRDDMLSWRAGVVFKPLAEGSLYASYGTSFNPSADGNTGLSLTVATVLLEPEKSRSAEVGVKWEAFDRRMLTTAALFQTEKTNARTPGINPGDPPTVLQGRQRVRGFEIGMNGRISDAWSAFAGYTFLESEVLESNTPAELGKELANTPEHSFTAWTSYRLPFNLELAIGGQFVDDRWNSPTNVRLAPSYWKLDASAAYDVNERLSLRLNASNLTDETYIDRVGGGHFIPGAGRSVALSTALRF